MTADIREEFEQLKEENGGVTVSREKKELPPFFGCHQLGFLTVHEVYETGDSGSFLNGLSQ